MTRQEEFTRLVLDRLAVAGPDIESQWRKPVGTATRHFVVDNLLPGDMCAALYDAFPKDGNGFFNRDTFREKKKTSANLDAYDPVLADITYAFQDRRVVSLIAGFAGFEKIEPDPRLYAGGLSMMFEGDFLNPHIDNSHDGVRQRYRRLNILYYVAPDWKLENGGNFELWDETRTVSKTIVAATNRMVVMETSKTSWHSVSPVTVARPRCCISNYYFSEISPNTADYFHVTSFTGRPDQKLHRVFAVLDNGFRNLVSRALKIGRGKDLINGSARR